MNEADVSRAAEFLGLTPEEFERKYVYRTARRMRLRVPKQANCHFLDGDRCSIHPSTPVIKPHAAKPSLTHIRKIRYQDKAGSRGLR